MSSLKQLIDKYGSPDALIDHWDLFSNRYAIWGFEEEFEISVKGECYLNGNKIDLKPLQAWQKTINTWKQDDKQLAAVGFISYDFKNLLFPHILFNSLNSNLPLMWFGKPLHIEKYEVQKDNPSILPVLNLEKDIPKPNEYKRAINRIKHHLKIGDCYQINFTQPKQLKLKGQPLQIYMLMRETIRPHYGIYINKDEIQILSFSPERFFRTYDNKIESFPMKGTSPRSCDIIKDELLAGNLYYSKKNRAEHLMIVDLLRNDIGKLCKYGTVKVENLYSIHSFESVHQMVSRVFGERKESINESDIIKALFPGGSITGAPKERSMQIIDQVEQYQRGIYTGSLGYIKNNGDMDFNIAIRTMSINNNNGIYPVGGGIVWDSDPIDEWKEAHQKSEIIRPYIYKNKIVHDQCS